MDAIKDILNLAAKSEDSVKLDISIEGVLKIMMEYNKARRQWEDAEGDGFDEAKFNNWFIEVYLKRA